MRARFLALPAALMMAGTAAAQSGVLIPNAIHLWRSDVFFGTVVNLAAGPGVGGHAAWQTMPPDVLTYFRNQTHPTEPGARRLNFRGFEITLFVPPAGAANNHASPQMELRRAIENPAAQARLLPDTANPALVTIPPVAIGVLPANEVLKFAVDLGSPGVSVPAGNQFGNGLSCFLPHVGQQFGGANSLMIVLTGQPGVLGFETSALSLSGLTLPYLAAGAPLYMDQLLLGGLTIASTENQFTYYFSQSLIQPVKNSVLVTGGTPLPGGGAMPVPFPFYMDDGRGALLPVGGDGISYTGNSNYQSLGLGPVWFIPLTMFDGDIGAGGGTDPLPENWVGAGGAPENSYIYKKSVIAWIDELLIAFGGTPGAGALLNPANSNQGLWLGVDLFLGLLNPTILVNSVNFADISGGPAHAGNEFTAYHSLLAPGGIFGRNLVNFAPTTNPISNAVGEHTTMLLPQTGYTDFVPTPNGFRGFGENPGGPTIAGRAFYVTCWMLDTASTTTVTNNNILDMTNVIKITLGA